MGASMNYFTQQAVANLYASARPYIHPWAITKIQHFLHLSQPLPQVLDVGCGTGQSSLALTALARHVIGIEPSEEMTRHALKHSSISYINASAEKLPFADASFPLVTASMAFHWFERGPFLAETARVLQPSGKLIIYSGGFLGKVPKHPELEHWYWRKFMQRYPIPTDFNKQPLTEQEARPYGFHFLHHEMYTLELSWSAQEFAAYLASMSLVNAVVERGEEKAEDALQWLISSLTPLFSHSTIALPFGGHIEYWQKS
jgi:ubiquinone/menaquinone biosynthesis C-methylase UbiE